MHSLSRSAALALLVVSLGNAGCGGHTGGQPAGSSTAPDAGSDGRSGAGGAPNTGGVANTGGKSGAPATGGTGGNSNTGGSGANGGTGGRTPTLDAGPSSVDSSTSDARVLPTPSHIDCQDGSGQKECCSFLVPIPSACATAGFSCWGPCQGTGRERYSCSGGEWARSVVPGVCQAPLPDSGTLPDGSDPSLFDVRPADAAFDAGGQADASIACLVTRSCCQADRDCNPDPKMASLAGDCVGGHCSCKSGFGLDPATGHCRESAVPPDAGACQTGVPGGCNDDPMNAEILGWCSFDGTCVCKPNSVDGSYEVNPATGRCRRVPNLEAGR